MARRPKLKWFQGAAGVREHAPVLVGDLAHWQRWRGEHESEAAFSALDDIVPVTVDERIFVPFGFDQSTFDVGVAKDELVVLQRAASEDPAYQAERAAAIADADEFLLGELAVTAGVIVGDSWFDGTQLDASKLKKSAQPAGDLAFFVPLPAGRYAVLEGEDPELDISWRRFVPVARATEYRARDAEPLDARQKEVEFLLKRSSFETEKAKASALEHARRLVELGEPQAALDVCAQMGGSYPAPTAWSRLFALAALQTDCSTELTALVEEWLRAPTSADSANQALTRADMLKVLDAAAATPGADALRTQVVAAPEPEVFAGGDGDFF